MRNSDPDLMILEKFLFYDEGVVLDDRLQKKLNVLEKIHEWIQVNPYKWEVIEKIELAFKLHKMQCYRLYNDAKSLFNPSERDILRNMMWKDIKMLKERGKYSDAVKLQAALLKSYDSEKVLEAKEGEEMLTEVTNLITFAPDILGRQLPENWREELQKLHQDNPYGIQKVVQLEESTRGNSEAN